MDLICIPSRKTLFENTLDVTVRGDGDTETMVPDLGVPGLAQLPQDHGSQQNDDVSILSVSQQTADIKYFTNNSQQSDLRESMT